MHLTADDLYKMRKVYRLTQVEMGALCNCSGAQINRIEKGKRNLTERVKGRLIRELQLTPEKLARIHKIYKGEI